MNYRIDAAREALRNGEMARAHMLLQQEAAADANNADVWYLLSFTEGDIARRRSSLERALQADARHESAEVWLGYLAGISSEPSLAQRAELLNRLIGAYLVHGWRVQHKTDTSVRLLRQKDFNTSSCCLFGIFYLGKRAGDAPETLFIEVTPDAQVKIY